MAIFKTSSPFGIVLVDAGSERRARDFLLESRDRFDLTGSIDIKQATQDDVENPHAGNRIFRTYSSKR